MKSFIFDVGNVLLNYDPHLLVSRVIGETPDNKYLADTLFDRYYWGKLDLDEIDIEDEKRMIKDVVPPHLYEISCHILDSWLDNITPIEGMRELLLYLRSRGYKLYYLSNICSQFIDHYQEYEHISSLIDLFDGGVISGKLHMVKPDKRIYEVLFKQYDINPIEAFYIDDSPINIKKGQELGLNTYLYDGDTGKLSEYIKGRY